MLRFHSVTFDCTEYVNWFNLHYVQKLLRSNWSRLKLRDKVIVRYLPFLSPHIPVIIHFNDHAKRISSINELTFDCLKCECFLENLPSSTMSHRETSGSIHNSSPSSSSPSLFSLSIYLSNFLKIECGRLHLLFHGKSNSY